MTFLSLIANIANEQWTSWTPKKNVNFVNNWCSMVVRNASYHCQGKQLSFLFICCFTHHYTNLHLLRQFITNILMFLMFVYAHLVIPVLSNHHYFGLVYLHFFSFFVFSISCYMPHSLFMRHDLYLVTMVVSLSLRTLLYLYFFLSACEFWL